MAVARIVADRRWFLGAAGAVRDVPRLYRELTRAAERRGLIAEIDADEARILAERLSSDERTARSLSDVQEAEGRERSRRRGVGPRA